MLGLSLVGDLQSLCYSSYGSLPVPPTLAPVGCWMCQGLSEGFQELLSLLSSAYIPGTSTGLRGQQNAVASFQALA